MNNAKINLDQFDFNQFQEDTIKKLKSGQPLTGKDGVLIPLIKHLLEAALEGEMDSHLSACKEDGEVNRRNGKSKKLMKTGTGSFEGIRSINRSRDQLASSNEQCTINIKRQQRFNFCIRIAKRYLL